MVWICNPDGYRWPCVYSTILSLSFPLSIAISKGTEIASEHLPPPLFNPGSPPCNCSWFLILLSVGLCFPFCVECSKHVALIWRDTWTSPIGKHGLLHPCIFPLRTGKCTTCPRRRSPSSKKKIGKSPWGG